jgi:hypothetical protein
MLINNTEIEYVNECNLLGIILQQNLKWRLHVDMVQRNFQKQLVCCAN